MTNININQIMTYMENHSASFEEAAAVFGVDASNLSEHASAEFDRQTQLHNDNSASPEEPNARFRQNGFS